MIKKYAFKGLLVLGVIALVLGVTGCASRKTGVAINQAPVEDRGVRVAQPAGAVPAGVVNLPLGAENAGKPGYYTIKPGDSLIRIGMENGQNWRDLARWNQLESPNRIEVGQVIRVIPPVSGGGSAVPMAVATPVPPVGVGSVATPPVTPPKSVVDEIHWLWPITTGSVLTGFDDSKNKGIDIGGKLGDAVLAAADGRVVYAGSGLRGYGNLVILKHNDTFLSAYAHNQTILVKEDQTVTKGQKIAEMGQSDSDRVKLHFEIRRQGKPVDPALYLPKR
jgi:lipoprotein NlpD